MLEVTRAAEDDYVAELDAVAGSTVWLRGNCSSWYVDERSGRLTLLWPDFAFAFRRRLSRFDGTAYGIGRQSVGARSVGDGDADAARQQRSEQVELA